MSVEFYDLENRINDLIGDHTLTNHLAKVCASVLYEKLSKGTIFERIDPFVIKPTYQSASSTLDLGLLEIEYKSAFRFPESNVELEVPDLDELDDDLSEIQEINVDIQSEETDWDGLREYVEEKYWEELMDAINNVDEEDYTDEDGDVDVDRYNEAIVDAEDQVRLRYLSEYERQAYDEHINRNEIEEALGLVDSASKKTISQYVVLRALFGDVFEIKGEGNIISIPKDANVSLGISEYDVVSSILPVPEEHADVMKKATLNLFLRKGELDLDADLLDDGLILNVKGMEILNAFGHEIESLSFGDLAERFISDLTTRERLEAIGKMLSFTPMLSVNQRQGTSVPWVTDKYREVIAAEEGTSFVEAITKEEIHTKAAMHCIIDSGRLFSSTPHKKSWASQLTVAIEASTKTSSFPKELVLNLEFNDVAFMTTGGTTLESVYNGVEFDRPIISLLGVTIKPVIKHQIMVACREQSDGVIYFGTVTELHDYAKYEPDGPIFLPAVKTEEKKEIGYIIPDGCTIDLRVESDLLLATHIQVGEAYRNLHISTLFTSNMGKTTVYCHPKERVIYCDKVVASDVKGLRDFTSFLESQANYRANLPKALDALLVKDITYFDRQYAYSRVHKIDGNAILSKPYGKMDGEEYALDVVDLVSQGAVSAFYESRGALRDYVIIKEASWKELRPISPLYWDKSGRYLTYNWPSTIADDVKFLTFLYGEDEARWNANVTDDVPKRSKQAVADDINLISNIGNIQEAKYTQSDAVDIIRDGKLPATPREYPFDTGVLNLLGYSKGAITKLNEGNSKKLKMATNTNFLAAYYSYGNFINIENRGTEYLGRLEWRYTETTVFSLQSAFNAMGVRGFTEIFTTTKGILPYMYDGDTYMHSGHRTPQDTFLSWDKHQDVHPESKARSRSVCFKLMYSIMETLTRPIVLLKNHISTLSQLESRPNPLDLDAKNEQFSSKGYYNAKTIEKDFIDSLKSIFDSVEYDGDKQLALFSKVVKYGSDRVLVTKLHAYRTIELDFSTVESTQHMLDAFTFSFNALALKEIFPVSMVEDQVLVNEGDTIKDMLLGAYPDLTDQQKEYLEYHISNYFSRHREDMLEEVVLELNKLVKRDATNFVNSYPQRGIVDHSVFFESDLSDILVYSNSRDTLENMTAYDRNLEAIRYGAIKLIYNNIMLKLTEIFSLYDGKEQTEKRDIFAAALKGKSGHINMVNVLDLLENPVAGTRAYKFFAENKIRAGKSTVEGEEVAYPMYNALIEDKNPIDYWSISQIIGCPRNKTITARYPDTNKTEERLSLFRYTALVETVYNSMKEFTGEGKDALGPTIAQYKDLKMTYITANEDTQIQNLITLGTAYKVCFGSSGQKYRTCVKKDYAEFLSILRKNKPRTFIYLRNAVISESKGIDNAVPFALKKRDGYGSWRDFMLQAQDLQQLKSILDKIQKEYNLEELAFLAVALTEVGVASGALPAETSLRMYHIDNMINLYALACLDYYNFKNAGAPDEYANQYLNGLLHHLGLELNDTADMMDAYSAFDDLVDAMPFEEVLANIKVEDTIKVSEDWKRISEECE